MSELLWALGCLALAFALMVGAIWGWYAWLDRRHHRATLAAWDAFVAERRRMWEVAGDE